MTEAAPTSGLPALKMPPLLLLAALVFWGWQSGFLLAGAIMGVVLESARFTRARWSLDDADFNRIWTFCVVLTVALAGYAFTTNETGHGLSGTISTPNATQSAVLTGARFMRWLPMITFGFIVAQIFNERPSVPLTAVSLVLRLRRRRGDRTFKDRYLDISFPYFMLCLFAAGIHPDPRTQSFFWGQCALVAWALWSLRSRRFGISIWLLALAVVTGLGILGGFGINQAERAIQNFNAQWMTRLFGHGVADPRQSITSIGQIGRLKLSAKIVIRLEPEIVGQMPAYLREASYRNYGPQNQTWTSGGPRNDFEGVSPESDNTSWVLVPGKAGAASVNIACYLNGRSRDGDPEGVLPLPSGCSRLVNLPVGASVIELQKNRTGAVLATGSGLMIFDARYGPGTTLDSPPDNSTNRLDLTVPTNEIPALKQVIAELNFTNLDNAQKLRAVKKYFFDKFTYSEWLDPGGKTASKTSPLTRFLVTSRSGHCEYFATATVLLLRQMEIPARYAIGYFVHETRGSGYVVRERDAHAWCLVWNDATKAWEDFDTTPPSWVAIEDKSGSAMQWLGDLGSWLGFQLERFRWRQAHLQQYIFASLVPVLVVLLYYIIFRRRRKPDGGGQRAGRREDIARPGLDSEFYLLERELAARGVARLPDEPLAEWLKRLLTDPALAGLLARLQGLLRLHYGHRFDPRGLSGPERKTLAREAKACLETLSQRERHPPASA